MDVRLEIPLSSTIKILLLTRSKNLSGMANHYSGATVLSLPLKKRRFLQVLGVLADVIEVPRPVAAFGESPILSELNILVVDDNIVNRRVCSAQLRKLGVWRISEAEDGRQAIAAAQNGALTLS